MTTKLVIISITSAVVLACAPSSPGTISTSAEIGTTGCEWIDPTPLSAVSQPFNSLCGTDCAPIFARSREVGGEFFVACVPQDTLQAEGTIGDAEVCLRSPVDHLEYDAADHEAARALVVVCWVPCSVTGPEDPRFDEWLIIARDVWTDRCDEAWSAVE